MPNKIVRTLSEAATGRDAVLASMSGTSKADGLLKLVAQYAVDDADADRLRQFALEVYKQFCDDALQGFASWLEGDSGPSTPKADA